MENKNRRKILNGEFILLTSAITNETICLRIDHISTILQSEYEGEKVTKITMLNENMFLTKETINQVLMLLDDSILSFSENKLNQVFTELGELDKSNV